MKLAERKDEINRVSGSGQKTKIILILLLLCKLVSGKFNGYDSELFCSSCFGFVCI